MLRPRRTALGTALGTALSVALLLPLAACGVLPPADLKPPRLRFSDLRITELGPSEIRFVLGVDTENPNDVDVPLRNVGFQLDLLGQPFASGAVIDRAVTLPRTGTKTVPVEFTVPTARLLDVLRRARGSDLSSLGYRLRGSASWGRTGIPLDFDRQGNLEVLRNFADLLRPLLAPR